MSSSLFPHLVKKFDGDSDVDQLQNGHFRAHRYLAGDLRPLRSAVTLTLAGSEVQCELIDLSERGISVRWDGPPPAGVAAVGLQIRFDGYVLFKGEARIVESADRHGTPALALDFVSPVINVPELLDLRSVKQWRKSVSGAGRDHPRRTPGYEYFKAQVAELHLLLEDTQQELNKLEQSEPWTSLAAEHQSLAWHAFVDGLRGTFVQNAVEIMEKIGISLDGGAEPSISALQSFSHRFLQPFLLESPTMRRAVEKPMGYPGDYHLMSAIQEEHIDGTTLFGKAMSLLFNELPFARAVRSRGLFMQRSLEQLIASRAPSSAPLRVFAISPGSGDELIALVSSLHAGVRLDVVVVDHDGASLTHIHDRVQRLKKERPDSAVTFTLRHEGVKHLLRDPGALDGFGEFDFIYSTTLFDYLRPQTCSAMLKLLASRLAPKGTLLVSAFSPGLWDRWLLELHLDWHLFYRGAHELQSLVAKAVPNLAAELVDGDDSNAFVKVTN